MEHLEFHPAERHALVHALGGYAAVMRWHLTCVLTNATEREMAARDLAVMGRMLTDLGEDPPDLGPLTDEQRHRCAAQGADPFALEAILRGGGRPQAPKITRGDAAAANAASVAAMRRQARQR